MTAGTCFCHKCDSITNWESYNSLHLRCEHCRDYFPCKKDCDHLDCQDEKEHNEAWAERLLLKSEHKDLHSVPIEEGMPLEKDAQQ